MSKQNTFFSGGDSPTIDLAKVLAQLDEDGHLSPEMRKAIGNHADNYVETLPGFIAASAKALGAASDGNELNAHDAAQVAYGIAGMAEQLIGYKAILELFDGVKKSPA